MAASAVWVSVVVISPAVDLIGFSSVPCFLGAISVGGGDAGKLVAAAAAQV